MKQAILAAFGLALLGLPAQAQSPDPSGTWLTQSGDTRVRIAKCGTALCGIIVSSTYQKDTNNPDPNLRERSMVGVQMISDIRPSSDGFSGQLYNPQDGKTYTGKLKVMSPNTLQLSGCVLGGLICRSQTWTKAN
ncbi:MAG: DUF2147 domain-containing protein [Microvirga sp.]|jgi:uncharacterized protein (DUF2147 family)|uniref:DUF2147 domain-containing protein n=1 Tax=Microvirga tunisiensis TaxID=2108360 RepID=A0A5N7MBC1_9HYPH|nr:DUF2147 domain-containing protein [Microvirga tunisiensis]MPR05868.1 DUF2147 domain-containing protein [Microvirga tunisiensis]MPR24203.1 DUF2147 domain-containing protein [Microvirga tunisiensis]